ncbi:DUF4345 domain-containing protein [Nocardia sp. NPDC050697]|uniref:DUF4345 domain-containing protein n=1 Tax=Nocardia sp. NPDC050697 TaxID=3155158 RepID=UPI00340EC546
MAASVLRWLALVMGVTCLLIGLEHLATGEALFPDMGEPGATADSQARFFGAVFAGYGLAWILAARRDPIPANVIRFLAGIMLLGAVGRFLSIAVHGWPHPFVLALTALEVLLPPVYLALADADEKQARVVTS